MGEMNIPISKNREESTIIDREVVAIMVFLSVVYIDMA